MKQQCLLKKQSKLKQKFRQLIEELRSKTAFQNKPHLSFNQVLKPIQEKLDHQITDILPSTHHQQSKFNNTQQPKIFTAQLNHNNPSLMLQEIKGLDKQPKQSQIEIKDIQSSIQIEHNYLLQKGDFQLTPHCAMKCPSNQGRVGQIRHQNTSINKSLSKKMNNSKQSVRYSKIDNKSEFKPKELPVQARRVPVFIKELDDMQVIKYWNKHFKIKEDSSQDEIYRYFETMMDQLAIDLDDPMIQKFKNCVYFGQKQVKTVYQGMIYYFGGKIYYGQFLNGLKHGHGVEINFVQNVKYAGIFNGGSKNGYFFVQKQKQNYEGILHYGLYHGAGKLMTEEYIYQGTFQNGKKHGYGQEVHPKTGLKVQGYFRQGQYHNFSETSKDKQKEQQQIAPKMYRTTMKKSDSYDIKVQLTSKLIKKEKSQQISSKKQDSSFENIEPQSVGQVEFQQDATSLFNLLQKRNKTSKYDIYVDKISKKLPKIHIEALPHRQSNLNPQSIIVNKKHDSADDSNLVLSKFQRKRPKPINGSLKLNQIEESPLTRKKQSLRPC